MWTAKKLSSAQILLLQMKEGHLCSCIFPKTWQFWIGIPSIYCTLRVPHNRVKFHVSKVNDKQSVVDRKMATSAEETKIAVGKSPSGVCDGRQHSLQAQMRHINLSFAACGFLGIYHLGAAAAFHRHEM